MRLTLEMVAQMRCLYPASESALQEIEIEVRRSGQMLIEAGSSARARAALEQIHRARMKLQEFAVGGERLAA